MTTSSINAATRRSRARRGFTLAEVLIAATIGAFILTGILASFLMMAKSGANLYNYVGMEEEARRGLEKFGEDTRMASGLITDSNWPDKVTLYLPDTSTTSAMSSPKSSVVYKWDNNPSSATYLCFLRTDSSGTTTLIHDVQSFSFSRYMQSGTLPPPSAATDAQTNQLQIHMVLQIQNGTANATSASNLVVSARFILRNKPSMGNYTTP